MDSSGTLKGRMDWKVYRSGHMMYLRDDDVIMSNEDIRQFILRTLPKSEEAAKY